MPDQILWAHRNYNEHLNIQFLVQIKNGNVKMFSFLFSLVLTPSAESLAISEQLYIDVSTYS